MSNANQSILMPSGVEFDTTFFDKRIWFIDDVAKFTRYAIGTLYNLTSKNLIPHKKKRGKLYFIPLEIQNWIDEGGMK